MIMGARFEVKRSYNFELSEFSKQATCTYTKSFYLNQKNPCSEPLRKIEKKFYQQYVNLNVTYMR